jgi:hypothetical protein
MAYSLDRKVPDISEIQALAVKYNKDQLRRLARMNLVDPGDAVMAGMMIDRIRAQNMQPPLQTVADDALGINVEPQVMPQQAMPQQAAAGVTALPSGLPTEMAGGGLVAFAEGGDVPGYAKGDLIDAADTVRRSGMTPDQLAQIFASAGPGEPADSGAPAVQPAQSGIQNLAFPKEAGMGGVKLRDYPTRPEPSLKSEFDLLREAQKEAGLDDAAMFRQMREEEKTRREELKGRKDQAFGNALIMAGFGLLGARKGEEFEVLSTVGRQGVMQYGAALKDIRETENDIRKAERQLTLAENQLKRDQSSKAQDRYDAKLKELRDIEIKSVDQYNKTVGDLTKLNMDVWKVNEEKAYRMAIAQLEANTRLAIAYAPSSEERLIDRQLAELKKTNPNATLADAIGVVKGANRPGAVTDKELQDAYEARLKEVLGKKAREEFLSKYPTWREFAAEQRGQSSAGAGAASSANRPSLSSFDKP